VVIGVDQPRSDSDFWTAFQGYVQPKADALGGITLQRTASDNDSQKLIANVQTLLTKGVQALVLAPQDTAAVGPALSAAAAKNVPVVTVDTRPDTGNAFMVVRADNKAYGTNACVVLGTKLGGKGTVVQFEGALTSINGRDRSEAFAACMKDKYPAMKVISIPTEWEAQPAIAGLKNAMAQGDVNGIYSQAGGVFLQPTLTFLQQESKLIPAGKPGHIAFVSNDGIASELKAIGDGYLDATVSQPADSYAGWALYYAQAAAQGKTFKPGPTDHDSTIIQVRAGLMEDQLPAPVVTKDGATLDGGLATVKYDSQDLWGNHSGS
jgi:simple sugar transport system substrate-binding protein/ribose transport system substrate-binding protein